MTVRCVHVCVCVCVCACVCVHGCVHVTLLMDVWNVHIHEWTLQLLEQNIKEAVCMCVGVGCVCVCGCVCGCVCVYQGTGIYWFIIKALSQGYSLLAEEGEAAHKLCSWSNGRTRMKHTCICRHMLENMCVCVYYIFVYYKIVILIKTCSKCEMNSLI